jgi:hypothetical protein
MEPKTRRLSRATGHRNADRGAAERAIAPDPARSLYEQAAGLLASAGALQAAARTSESASALGPTLALVEASFDALADVAKHLGDQAIGHPRGEMVPTTTVPAEWEIEHRFRDLITAVGEAQIACGHARDAVGPVRSCARLARL